MNRRQLLAAAPGLLLLGAGRRPPQNELHLAGTLSWRGQPVFARATGLRVALFESAMARNPLWSKELELELREGRLDLRLGRRQLGTPVEEVLPARVFVQVQVAHIGEEVLDARLAPRVELDWAGTGQAACLGEVESLSNAESGCVMTGPGSLVLVLHALARAPLPAAPLPADAP